MRHTPKVSLVLGVVATVVMAISSASFAQNSGKVAAPPNSKPYGKSYAEWSEAWWQWSYGLPAEGHPLFDETGADAARGQSGPVWFLGGVFNVSGSAHRSITVPKGTSLFFPVLNVEWDNICPPGTLTIEELRATAASFADLATDLVCEVDGVAVANLSQYRVPAGPFSITLPDGNLFQLFGCTDVVAGTYGPLMGDGYYVMVAPLSKGQHTLHFAGTFGPPVSFTLDIVYDITVTDRNAASASASASPLSKAALSRAAQAMRTASPVMSLRLGQPSMAPNPVRDSGLLRFSLSRPGHVEAKLYDVKGRVVRSLAEGSFEAGNHELRFDRAGRDPLPGGVYFYRIVTDEGKSEGRMILLQ